MKKKNGKYRVLLATAIGLLVMLPVLALIQYNWLAKLSRSESVQMRANLETTLRHVADGIRQELFLAARVFLRRSAEGAGEAGVELARLYDEWLAVAHYPSLLRDVYWAGGRAADGEGPALHRLVPETRELQRVDWPEELLPWRSASLTGSVATGAIPSDAVPSTASTRSETAVFRIPAMELSEVAPGHGRGVRFQAIEATERAVLLVFDLEVLARTAIPDLLETYLARDGRMDYDVLLVDDNDPGTVLYHSSPHLTPADFQTADAAVWIGIRGPVGLNAASPEGRQMVVRSDGEGGAIVRMNARSGEAVGVRESGNVQIPAPQHWRLLARHKAGSLDAVVAQTRRRNLAVSMGVLVLLGGAILLILQSARRAHQLADQQMAFVAGVSHELRTPIAVVHAAGENLQDGLATDREEVGEYGRLIVRESRRLLDMVEQVLAFSGISFGQNPTLIEPVRIEAVLQKALANMGPLISDSGVRVEKRMEPDLPDVMGDEAALTAALQNLLQNAVKYGGGQAWMGLDARIVELGREREVQISVSDRGPGVSPSERGRIFDPFYRSKAVVEAGIRGNGLGLSVVKNVVEAHGGRVEVTSQPGNGSRFTICLKAVDGHREGVADGR